MFATLLISYFSPSLFCNASPLNPSFFISKLGVPTIFLLSSLNLPAASLLSSLLNPINIPIQLISLLIIPLLNILLSKTLYPLLFPPPLIKGLLILAALPTTVNMCIALTTNANASTPTAVTNAVLGNLLGVIVTPLWFAYFFSTSAATSALSAPMPLAATFLALSRKVLLPMAVGQALRRNPAILSLAATPQSKKASKFISEAILLSIVWNSFSNAFVAGLPITLPTILLLLTTTSLLHLLYFAATYYFLSTPLSFSHSLATAGSFVSSHKTLAFGLPLIKTVFANDPLLPLYCAPLLLIHPAQLFLGGFLPPARFNNQQEKK